MFALLTLSLLSAAPPLTTLAEQTGWKKTGRYDEVVSLCAAFPRRYPGKVVRAGFFGEKWELLPDDGK